MTSSPEAIRRLFRYSDLPNFPPRYNIAPTQPIAIVRLEQGKRRFALVRWGFIPSWAKDPRMVSLMFNARGETVIDKPAYRAAMRRRRCLVPVDGFYEWRRAGARSQPYYVRRRDGKPFAFAGVWETWTGPNGEEIDTAAIITTRANNTLSSIHERMPVVLPEGAYDLWLGGDEADAETAAALIAPAPDDLLEAYEVSSAVNRTANDGPSLLEPCEPSRPDPQPPARARKAANDAQGRLF
jgi:putative SOS response-associated peptidase YedK